jgi:hypothetical protein
VTRTTVINGGDYTIRATVTNFFLGTCPNCKIPFRDEVTEARGNVATLVCPTDGCGARFTGERLSATLTTEDCDPRCMGAVGPICQCACGGANHGGSWGRRARRGEDFTSALERLQARQAATEAKRAKKREQAAARARKAFDAWAGENADVVEFLQVEANITFEFLEDMARHVRQGKELTEGQARGVRKCMVHVAKRAEQDRKREEERAAAGPVPTGKVEITGEIVSVKWKDNNYGPGGSDKMIVKLDNGSKVWGTAPAKIMPNEISTEVVKDHYGLRGKRVTFTATVEASEEDKTFGFFKRPTQVKLHG